MKDIGSSTLASQSQSQSQSQSRASTNKSSRAGLPPSNNVPAASVESLIERQKESLLRSLQECRLAEEKRSVRFEKAVTASERVALEARFDLERAQDQERLQRLTTDFNLVRKAVMKGEINETVVESRQQLVKKKILPKLELDHNRFAGAETYADLVKHEGIIKMFEKTDRQAELKRLPKFDPYPIQKNLALLRQKRDILQKLVSVQTRAHNAASSSHTQSQVYSYASGGASGRGRSADTASVYTDASSSSSKASWATFASHEPPSSARQARAARVPPLKLPGQ